MTAHGSMILLGEAQVPRLLPKYSIKMYHVWRHRVRHPSGAWWRLNYDNCSTTLACGSAIMVAVPCNLAWNIYSRMIFHCFGEAFDFCISFLWSLRYDSRHVFFLFQRLNWSKKNISPSLSSSVWSLLNVFIAAFREKVFQNATFSNW